jgi:hypothetical protein
LAAAIFASRSAFSAASCASRSCFAFSFASAAARAFSSLAAFSAATLASFSALAFSFASAAARALSSLSVAGAGSAAAVLVGLLRRFLLSAGIVRLSRRDVRLRLRCRCDRGAAGGLGDLHEQRVPLGLHVRRVHVLLEGDHHPRDGGGLAAVGEVLHPGDDARARQVLGHARELALREVDDEPRRLAHGKGREVRRLRAVDGHGEAALALGHLDLGDLVQIRAGPGEGRGDECEGDRKPASEHGMRSQQGAPRVIRG